MTKTTLSTFALSAQSIAKTFINSVVANKSKIAAFTVVLYCAAIYLSMLKGMFISIEKLKVLKEKIVANSKEIDDAKQKTIQKLKEVENKKRTLDKVDIMLRSKQQRLDEFASELSVRMQTVQDSEEKMVEAIEDASKNCSSFTFFIDKKAEQARLKMLSEKFEELKRREDKLSLKESRITSLENKIEEQAKIIDAKEEELKLIKEKTGYKSQSIQSESEIDDSKDDDFVDALDAASST